MKIQQNFTLFHRILHWLIAIAMCVLFITGFLRMYWMNKNNIVNTIQSKTSAISKEQMTEIAKSIREPMWQWHELFANIMILAFLTRIIYMIAKGIRFPNPFKSNQPLKERFQGYTYIYFYTFVLISAVTGIFMENKILMEWKETIEAVHKLAIYWFPIFILLHIIGIIVAEYTTKKGIVSKIIGGDS